MVLLVFCPAGLIGDTVDDWGLRAAAVCPPLPYKLCQPASLLAYHPDNMFSA